MKLFEQLIRKKLDLYEESFITKNYKRAVWHFYVAYNISCSIAQFQDPLIRKKNRLYKRFLLSQEHVNSRVFKKIQKIMRKDMDVIIEAVRVIDKKKEEAGYEFGEYYRPLSLGILAYEYPEEGY